MQAYPKAPNLNLFQNKKSIKAALKSMKAIGLNGKFVVLFIGRLLEIKGVRVLLDVTKRLSNLQDIVFVFVGDRPLSNEIKDASAKLQNVFYMGKVENRKLRQYYTAAYVFIAPSIYEEGFGRVILEALSCGTPLIVSNISSLPEIVGAAGLTVDP